MKDYHGNLSKNNATRGNPSLDKLYETEHSLRLVITKQQRESLSPTKIHVTGK
jgi:hypothetical protein